MVKENVKNENKIKKFKGIEIIVISKIGWMVVVLFYYYNSRKNKTKLSFFVLILFFYVKSIEI